MDTIVALGTPPGRSAIGVIRLSGPDSLAIVRSIVADNHFKPEPSQSVLRTIRSNCSNTILDRALITYFPAPNSYTGEHVVEISCHGSPVILRQVVDLTLGLGARLADPGEFTLRALSNGKLNLSQAEAIRDLINAQTEAAAQQALRQLTGELSVRLQGPQQKLIQTIVQLESALEFVEDDLPQLRKQNIVGELTDVARDLDRMASTFEVGHLLRDGLKVTFAGRPNVGKSSLFNMLLASERAIVTEVPGTTRDTLTERISLSGVPILLTDTAGLRDSMDRIEGMGVERTRQAMAEADLLVVVIDGSEDLLAEDLSVLLQAKSARHIVAMNKSDVPSFDNLEKSRPSFGARAINVSAVTGFGLEALRAAILEPFGSVDLSHAGFLITDARHYDLLLRARAEVQSSLDLLQDGASEELVLIGLHNGLRYLGQITGETTTDEILSEIFATFCIGK
ncbi:MAG: tRNA uridine-5-carboxymethylaminomethyl(34) synthesis GTPase MnmE [Pyrinomonadaceae bacterium]|nr:tRNA uridine-5-carboxymethylaminomethyl(34) synthesis GTPase MnmE [Pyrinomonadaceae bacterium]